MCALSSLVTKELANLVATRSSIVGGRRDELVGDRGMMTEILDLGGGHRKLPCCPRCRGSGTQVFGASGSTTTRTRVPSSGATSRRDIHKLVAVTNREVVGWCMTARSPRGYGPRWRPLYGSAAAVGLGERLLRESLAAADAFGYLRVELGVFSSNTRAASLYRKAGFVQEGIKRRAILINGVLSQQVLISTPHRSP